MSSNCSSICFRKSSVPLSQLSRFSSSSNFSFNKLSISISGCGGEDIKSSKSKVEMIGILIPSVVFVGNVMLEDVDVVS